MELSDKEIFLVAVIKEFDFLRTYGYDNQVSIYDREPCIIFSNIKINRKLICTYLDRFDLEITTEIRKLLTTVSDSLTLTEIVAMQGFKLMPFVPVDAQVKWISTIIQDNYLEIIEGKKWKEGLSKSLSAG
ncbi:MAG: hypothetical protein WDA22_17550 [Bacteroidota bacterium]